MASLRFSAMPMPLGIARPAHVKRRRGALSRCAGACAWCAARPPRGQASAGLLEHAATSSRRRRLRCGRRAVLMHRLARNSLHRPPRGAKQFASSSGSLGFRSCGAGAPRDVWSESNPVLPSPRREETARLHGGIKAREVAMSFGRPLTPFVQPTPEPSCRRAPKPFSPRRHTSRGKP